MSAARFTHMDLVLDRLKKAKDEHLSTQSTPFICATWAQSLDGYISVSAGIQTTVSCEETFEMAHEIRSIHDAILVGIGTILVDNPRLNARLSRPVESPCPVILDSDLRTPSDARFLQLRRGCRPKILCTQQAFDRSAHTQLAELADIIPIQNPPEHRGIGLYFPSILNKLYDNNIRSIMIEGGGKVHQSVLSGSHANYAVVSVTPRLFGGGVSVFSEQASNAKPKNSALPLVCDPTWHTVGSDVVLSGYPTMSRHD